MKNHFKTESRKRRPILSCCLFAFLAAAVFAASTMLVDSEKNSPVSANDPKGSEDLIEAVMFNTGPMVSEIDAIDGALEEALTTQQYLEYRSFARDIIDESVASDPAAMNAAVVDLQSGNPSMVDRAIGQLKIGLSEATESKLVALGLEHQLANASDSGGYGYSLVFALAAYVVLAVHAYLALTALAAVVLAGGAFIAAATFIAKTSWFWNGANVNGLTAIENDRFVSQLAADLAS